MRYELRPQKWNEVYRYDGGWCIFDTQEQRQVGWILHPREAQAWVDERNTTQLSSVPSTSPTASSQRPV
jgi:hypothetical protein